MTRRLLPLGLPLLLAGLLAACPRPAAGCAVLPPHGDRTTINSESALVVYDSAAKTEHFIRTASFQSTSAEFGFMVPTPAKPELAEASAEVFGALADVTKRRTVVQQRAKALEFGCGLLPMSKMALGEAAPAGKADVRVVEQKRVGDYDATVLQAAEAKSLRDWLTANGYDARPALDPWFEAYTRDKWYITAFKVAADSPAAGGNTLALTSSAVRISFPTDRPFYPYREPADMRAVTGVRQLKLFVLSDERVTGTIGSGEKGAEWAARTEWSGKVPAERMAAVAERGKLPASVGQREWHLTEFVDNSSPRPGTDELYLTRADDQSAVERPPLVVWEEYDPWPWVFGGIALLGGAALGAVAWRVLKAKPTG